jgi:F-type H+-transporting ATPase subunit g
VSGSTLRLIAKHEKIGIPSASGLADAQASFGHLFTSFQTGAWKKVTVGQVGKMAAEGAKIGGFFIVGEMIGRRSIVGYDVG